MPHWHMLLLKQYMETISFPNLGTAKCLTVLDADKGRGFDGEGCASLKPVMNATA